MVISLWPHFLSRDAICQSDANRSDGVIIIIIIIIIKGIYIAQVRKGHKCAMSYGALMDVYSRPNELN